MLLTEPPKPRGFQTQVGSAWQNLKPCEHEGDQQRWESLSREPLAAGAGLGPSCPRRDRAGTWPGTHSACSAPVRLSPLRGSGGPRAAFVSCFPAASACLGGLGVCDMKAPAINTSPPSPKASWRFPARALHPFGKAGSGRSTVAPVAVAELFPAWGRPPARSHQRLRSPARLADVYHGLQMFIAADTAALALCTRGRRGSAALS